MELSAGIHDVCRATHGWAQVVFATQVDTASTETQPQAGDSNCQVVPVGIQMPSLRGEHFVEGNLLHHRKDGQVPCLAPSPSCAGGSVPVDQSHAFC